MIEPYRFYYQESIKRSFTNNSNNPSQSDDGLSNSPIHSRKKKGSSEQVDGHTHQDIISDSLKTPPPTPSPPTSITLSQRRNIVKSLNKKPSMTKRLEKTTRMPKTKAVKASMSSSQHQRQHSSLQLHGPHIRRHYKDSRPSSYTSINKAATRSRKIPVNNSLRLSYNNSLNSLNRSISSTPPFDKDILDTFCFHWPAMHCYVLVRILPRSVAILPIRTRLAFLYFCHAPRPRQPSLQDLHRQQLHGRRIQSMFKSWKHTLAFNDSSSSSTSSDDDGNDNKGNDDSLHRNTNDSQLGHDRSMPNKKDHFNQHQQISSTKKNSSTQLIQNHQHQYQHHDQHAHHHQRHYQQPHHQHHQHPQHHHHHHPQHPQHHHHNYTQQQNHSNGIRDQSKPTKHRYTSSKDSLSKHRRQRSAFSSSTEEGGGDADYYSKEGKAVTLSDVLKDHRTGDVCWIHAPCKIQKPSIIYNDDTFPNNNNFVTLQSRRTTLELKARCYSEKKMFINLFKLNRLVHSTSKKSLRQYEQQQQQRQRNVTEVELMKALETQNDKLQFKISQLHDQMEQWQQDILHYEEQCGLMEERLDMTMTAVQHHKEQHVDYEELTETMAGTRQELKSHMDDFHKTHQRILHQHAGNTGSFSWVIEKSFQRLHQFQDLHSTQSGPAVLYISLVTGVLVLLLAGYIGYYHT